MSAGPPRSATASATSGSIAGVLVSTLRAARRPADRAVRPRGRAGCGVRRGGRAGGGGARRRRHSLGCRGSPASAVSSRVGGFVASAAFVVHRSATAARRPRPRWAAASRGAAGLAAVLAAARAARRRRRRRPLAVLRACVRGSRVRRSPASRLPRRSRFGSPRSSASASLDLFLGDVDRPRPLPRPPARRGCAAPRSRLPARRCAPARPSRSGTAAAPPIVASALTVMVIWKRSSRSRRCARLWLST